MKSKNRLPLVHMARLLIENIIAYSIKIGVILFILPIWAIPMVVFQIQRVKNGFRTCKSKNHHAGYSIFH